MKLRVVLASLLLLISCGVFSQSPQQDSLVEHYYKYPKQALLEAEVMYKKAVKEKNKTLLIRAIIIKTAFSLAINKEEFPQLIAEVEKHITEEKDVKTKSILHSYAGELYCRYYHKNRYQIYVRTDQTGAVPENIESWGRKLFSEKILSHFLASVEEAEVLQQTPVSDYRLILLKGSSDSLRPTLYDFLCYRAIETLQDIHTHNDAPSVLSSPDLLKNLDAFLKIPFEGDVLDGISSSLKIWQDLLAFQLKSGSRNSLLTADLGRLIYFFPTHQVKERDSIYLSTLRELRTVYAETPMVVEVMAKEAELLSNNTIVPHPSASKQNLKAAKQTALAICEEGIQQYPRYNRINLLRGIMTKIKAPSISTSFPKMVYPGEQLPLKISSKNISSVKVALYQVLMNTTQYQEQQNKNKQTVIPKRLVYEREYSLIADLVPNDTTLFLDVPQTGLYEVVCKVKKAKENPTGDFICTRIFSTSSRNGKDVQIDVYDWQSGKPIANAKVLFYKNNDWRNYQVIDSAYTNSQGTVCWSVGKEENTWYYYQVTQPGYPADYLNGIARIYTRDHSEQQGKLITDRKIYRPGQTVYFKGISWQGTTDTLYALNGKKHEVIFRDANEKEIKKEKFTSNSFGSFSGSFVIPRETLNGEFMLEFDRFHTFITVADYKRPEFEIILEKPTGSFYAGDTICIQGQVKSFSGVVIANRAINYELSSDNYMFLSSNPMNKSIGMCYTDVNGEFEVRFVAKAPWSITDQHSFFYQLQASLTDSKGETQEAMIALEIFNRNSKTVPITPIIPQQVNKDEKTAFRILIDNPLALSTIRNIHYTLAKLRPSALSEEQDRTIEQVVLEGEMQMGRIDSLFPNLQGFASGAYLFTVKCDGSEGSQIFYLYSNKDKRPPVATYEWLVKEKTHCLPGEKARIRFGTSVQNAYVRYQVYSKSKLLLQKDVVLSDEIMDIEVPYSASYGNQIWVCITYVKDKRYIQQVVPIRRIHEERNLVIETRVFRDKLQPGQEEQWELRITDSKKRPVDAELLAMMYDSSLDKLKPYPFNFKIDYIPSHFPVEKQEAYGYRDNNFQYLSDYNFVLPNFKSPSFDFSRLECFDPIKFRITDRYSGAKIRIRGVNSAGGMFCSSPDPQMQGELCAEESIDAFDMRASMSKSSSSSVLKLRENFEETAFFYPQLRTDSTGKVCVRFKMPESLTQWKFVALATTRDMANQAEERYITTSKPLMVRPNLPRFLRSGDEAEIKATVSNISDSLQEGVVSFELFAVDNDKVVYSQSEHFRVTAGGNHTVGFRFKVPANMDLVGCRIVAKGNRFSDGEQRLLPILPDETLITETLPIYATTSGEHSFTLTPSVTKRKDYRLTLELTSNPIWYAVLALPSLQEVSSENVTNISASFYVNTLAAKIVEANPKIAEAIRRWNASADDVTLLSKLENNQELKSILLAVSPWVTEAQNETERMQMLVRLFDKNRLAYLQEEALNKLAAMQTTEGGWGWFKGMNTSRFMTLNTLTIMAKAVVAGEKEYNQNQKQMQIKALNYLDKEIQKDFKERPKYIGYDQIVYLYTRSLYRDIPLGEALEAHHHFMALARKQWSKFSLYEKAVIAMSMGNYGFSKEANEIIQSLREYAINNPQQGMYWPNNRNEFFRNSAVQVHTVIMEAFQSVGKNEEEVNRMKQWLLQQKQVQNWGSVPATVDAIHALVTTGTDDLLNQADQLKIKLGKQEIQTPASSNPLGYIKESYTEGGFRPDMLTVKLEKQSTTPSWGGLYLQYFTKLEQVKSKKGDLSIEKELFLTENSADGKKVLSPLEKRDLKVGDLVTVRLMLTLNRDMEFLHLKDLRAGCLEPTEQLSGNQWRFGTMYYQEVKDAASNFFFTFLAKGTHVIEYELRINQAGNYQDGIATLQCIYAPEFSAFSEASKVKVGE